MPERFQGAPVLTFNGRDITENGDVEVTKTKEGTYVYTFVGRRLNEQPNRHERRRQLSLARHRGAQR